MVFALAISCAACSINAGTEKIQNETDASLQTKIVQGTTTKEEVRAALGAPAGSSITDSGNEQWLYYVLSLPAVHKSIFTSSGYE